MGVLMTEQAQGQDREFTRDEVEASLRAIFSGSLGVSESEVVPSASLVRDLGAESIDFLDIGFEIQQKFGVDLKTAEIRHRIMAWGALILMTLAEILSAKYETEVTAEELRPLEGGGIDKVLEHLRATRGITPDGKATDEVGRELVRRLIKEFSALGFSAGEADQEDLVTIIRSDLGARRLTERTLDLLTVDSLVHYICDKLGPRLRTA
jgi:acyl carrier protein